MRPHLAWFLAVLLLSVAGSSCDDEQAGPIGIMVSLSAGQRWTYDFTQFWTDSAGTVVVEYHDSVEVRVAATDDEVFGMSGLVRLEARTLLPEPVSRTLDTIRVWYRISDRSIVEVAYQDAAAFTLLKGRPQGHGRIITPLFDPLRSLVAGALDGSPIQREEERLVLLHPITQYASWVSFTIPFRQTREVEALEDVVVPAGRFPAARIRSSSVFGGTRFVFYDWVGRDGLIKRSTRFEGDLASPEGPDVLGRSNTTSETLLTSVVR